MCTCKRALSQRYNLSTLLTYQANHANAKLGKLILVRNAPTEREFGSCPMIGGPNNSGLASPDHQSPSIDQPSLRS